MPKILLVEDDPGIANSVALNLRYVGYDVTVFPDGLHAFNHVKIHSEYDLALLYIMLPGMDGFELFDVMKNHRIPVIYMTAKTDSASEVKGLREGAEDYIVKPFDMTTLLVRIEKVLGRTGNLRKEYTFFDFVLDTENRKLTKAGEKFELAPLEFDVLVILVKNKNRTVSREMILNEIWGIDYFGDTRTVDVRVSNIRKKLGIEIATISKVGYRLECGT